MVMKTLFTWLLILGSILGPAAREVAEDNPIDLKGQKWLNSLFTIPEGPRIRKEYRLLTDEERARYHDAFIQLRNDTVRFGGYRLGRRHSNAEFSIKCHAFSCCSPYCSEPKL